MSRECNPWKSHDLHRHSLDNLPKVEKGSGFEDGQHQSLLEAMHRIFQDGASVQAITDHSHDFVRTNVPWREYLDIFASVPAQNGQKKLLGMELNVAKDQGAFMVDYETMCDAYGTGVGDIARHLDFVILSFHDHYYSADGKRIDVNIQDIETYYHALQSSIHLSSEIRNRFSMSGGAYKFEGGIPVVLGHSWIRAAEMGWRRFTGEELRVLARTFYEYNVFPELNHIEISTGKSDIDDIGTSVMGHYIAFGRESGLTPLISIGTDWHERNPDYNQNTADLPDWIVDALEKKQIIVWYDALKQS